ncbi:MAG: hypothetical protein K0S07_1655 [Chlamydiales bacterium]|nr:hypothetical protein [Chlamydiales bacterium]
MQTIFYPSSFTYTFFQIMSQSLSNDEISFSALRQRGACITLSSLKNDISAALAIALMTLPQSLGCALVAKVPLSAGLFASIFGTLIASLFGRCHYLIAGPSNAVALLLSSAVAELTVGPSQSLSPQGKELFTLLLMAQITFLAGVLQVLAAFFKLGKIAHFISYPVVNGYLLGVALNVIISQLFPLLGVVQSASSPSLFAKLMALWQNFPSGQWTPFCLGGLCLALVFAFKLKAPKWPATLSAVLLTTFLYYLFAESFHVLPKVPTVQDIGQIAAWPSVWQVPELTLSSLNQMLAPAFAIALLGLLETAAIAKSLPAKESSPFFPSHEVLSLGLSNLFLSLIAALPISGSPSRTQMNIASGGKTFLSGALSGILLLLFLLLFSSLLNLIPLAALAAILVNSALSLVRLGECRLCFKASSSDRSVLIATALACSLFTLDVAFYVGASLSIILYLKKVSSPEITKYSIKESGDSHPLYRPKEAEGAEISVVNIEGELFFGAANLFESQLMALVEGEKQLEVLILRLKNARGLDATGAVAFRQIHDLLKNQKKHLILAQVKAPLWSVLKNSGVLDHIEETKVFLDSDQLSEQVLVKALNQAKGLIKKQVKAPKLFVGSRTFSITYKKRYDGSRDRIEF